MSLGDAVVIAQFVVGTRVGVSACPIDPVAEIMLPAGDLNGNGVVSLADALLIAQCAVGRTNPACPPPPG